MKIYPIILFAVATFSLLSDVYAGVVLPEQANLIAGIRTGADFDWSSTNIVNNKAYFESESNFFDSDTLNRNDYTFDSTNHGFLNARKLVLNFDKKGKTRRQVTNMSNAGIALYNQFGSTHNYSLNAADTVTGMGADTGNGNEKFEIFGGSTGLNMEVSLQFRSKSDSEKHGSHDFDGGHSDNTIIGHSPLVSNVMRLHGMGIQAATSDGRVKTNPFALEATYTQEDYDATYSQDEYIELINGCLFLGWINSALDGDPTTITGADRWVHAVQGNYDNMPDNANRHDEHGVIGSAIIGSLQNYIDGTATSIQGLTKAAGEIRVGDHGGDPNGNTVWAVIDHNSDFAVIPEPSTYALIGGVICLATVLLRRRK